MRQTPFSFILPHANAPGSNTHTETQCTERQSPWLPTDPLLPAPGGGRRELRGRTPMPGRTEAKPEGEGAKTVKTECAPFRTLPRVFHIPLFWDKEERLCVQKMGMQPLSWWLTPTPFHCWVFVCVQHPAAFVTEEFYSQEIHSSRKLHAQRIIINQNSMNQDS